jgi:glycosyltransferase involved in cell wall biosynthesis
MDRPKILLTNFHAGTGGGHRTYVRSILEGALADRFDFALACPVSSSINSLSRENGSRVFDLDFPGSPRDFLRIVESVRKLDCIHRQFPFEILHCNGSRDHWIALYWQSLYRRRTRIVRTRHAVKKIDGDFVHDWAFNRATALHLFVSGQMVPLCDPQGRLKTGKVKIIPNGVDTAYFQPGPRDVELAARLGIGAEDLVIGSNAGLGPHKRADLMIQGVASLPDRQRFKIVLLGEQRSGLPYLEMARDLGLEGSVIYGGMLDDVRPYLSLFDLGFVLSESIETSSYAAKEMMAMGIPLICARYSGLPENVDEGQNGFLVEPGSIDGVREALANFLKLSPEDRKRMGRHGREKVARQFSRQRQFDLLQQAYLQVLAPRAVAFTGN